MGFSALCRGDRKHCCSLSLSLSLSLTLSLTLSHTHTHTHTHTHSLSHSLTVALAISSVLFCCHVFFLFRYLSLSAFFFWQIRRVCRLIIQPLSPLTVIFHLTSARGDLRQGQEHLQNSRSWGSLHSAPH